MIIHLKIIGILFVILASVHTVFPSYFQWKTELAGLQLINRQIMYVHTFFIALFVLLIGLLCLTSSSELVNTPLGRRISIGLGLFWIIRWLFQFFGYSSAIWKGKRFETIVHIFFGVFWLYVSVVFFLSGWA